jgi:hypothetical protein
MAYKEITYETLTQNAYYSQAIQVQFMQIMLTANSKINRDRKGK